MDNSESEMVKTPEVKQSESSKVEEIVGNLIGESKVLEEKLAKVNNKLSGFVNPSREEKKELENVSGYFPKLIRGLRYLGRNMESIRRQINELDKI